MQNFRSARSERVRFVVAEIVQELRLRVFVGIRGVNSIDVGPDHEFVGIDNMRDDRAREIGTVAAERCDSSVGSRADETGDDGNDSVFEQWRERGMAAALCLL